MGFCGECGAKDEGGKFCPECGALSSGNAGLFGDASTALFPSAPAPPPAATSVRVDAERKATAAREMAEQARQDAAKAAVFFEETENRRLEDAFRLEEQQRLIHAANQREDIMARQRDAHAKREAAERQAEEARQRAIKVLTIRFSAREDAEAKAAEAKAAAEALRQKAMAAAAALEDQRRAQQQRALEREESRRLRDEQRERDAQAARATEARAQREAAERHADAARAKAELLRAEAVAAEANRLQKQSSLRHLQQQQQAVPMVSSFQELSVQDTSAACSQCLAPCKASQKFCPKCGFKRVEAVIASAPAQQQRPTADQIATMEADDNEVRRNMASAQARLDAKKLSEQQSRSFASSLAAQAQVASASRQPPPPTSSNYALF
ncbi:hypothetical protein DYB37_013151 [Aphanomyces astaci]|uniref:Uncharacterized protein n=1 Tax=Aphanomyces astaci TaxID=112090 RepID=A0A3R6YRC2_APHAT|nr:hypothetical protein DYB37_013151 [Aphanomyces astaci]